MEKVTRRPGAPAGMEGADFGSRQTGPTGEPAPSLLDRARAILRTALPRGAVILSVVTLASYAVGLLKAKVLAHYFGAGTDTDAFNAAFQVPQLALEILVMGGLLATFVPIFVGLRDEEKADAREFARTVLTLAILVMTLAVGVLFIFAPQAVAFTAPGFTGAQRDLCIDLFRLLCVTQVIFAASWVLGEILIAERRWIWYALATALYSGGIIAGTVLLGDRIGIHAAAVGAIAGSLAHLGIRLIGIFRTSFRPWPSLNLRVRGLRQFVWLSLPKMISQPIDMLTIIYFTRLASTLEAGSVTRLNYAREFGSLPVLLIGTQFAIAALPALSAAANSGDRRGFRRIFQTNLATIAVLTTGAALGVLVLGRLGISILLKGGAFTEQDVAVTAMLLAVFAASIPLEAATELLARALYATRNTAMATAAQLSGFVAIVITAQALAPAAGLLAIPAAYGVGMGVKLVILSLALAPRMDGIGRGPTSLVAASALAAPRGQVRWKEGQTSRPYGGSYGSRAGTGRVPRIAIGLALAACLAVGGLYAASQALQDPSLAFGFAPKVTPWARANPTADLTTPTPGATPQSEATPNSTIVPMGPTPAPTPPGQFAMDLYQAGDFIEEYRNTWCVPAAMQTMMNIMDLGADTSEGTQARLFGLAKSISESRNGTPEPEGWAQGLQQLKYGKYEVGATSTMAAAVKLVVKQIRQTNRPAGLLVWYGWHSWVVSGFTSSADPALTDNYTVISLRIEDVWYGRISTLWNKTRGGASRPPDSDVPYGELSQDFKAWDQAVYYPGKQKQFVFVIPVE